MSNIFNTDELILKAEEAARRVVSQAIVEAAETFRAMPIRIKGTVAIDLTISASSQGT